MLYRKIPSIYGVIDEFAAWKYDRHPLIAGGQKSLLYRFASTYKISTVEEITENHLAFFIGEELSAFYAAQALRAIRSFLWYCHHAGYNTISYTMATENHLKRVGRKTDWDMVKKVKELRESRGLSYNEIGGELSAALNKKVHRNSIVRWYKKATQLPF